MSFISEMRTLLKRTAEDFALGANRHGWELDFTSASLNTVDHMLDAVLDAFPPGRAYCTWPDARMPAPVGNLVASAVAYMGEVTIRERGGQWFGHQRWGVVIQLPGVGESFVPQLALAQRSRSVRRAFGLADSSNAD